MSIECNMSDKQIERTTLVSRRNFLADAVCDSVAAGAIPPRDAFRYAFSRGADFILAGMFDFQIAENAKVTQEMCTRIKERERPWRG